MEDNAIAIFLSAKEGLSDQEIKEKMKVIRFFKGKLSKEEMDNYNCSLERLNRKGSKLHVKSARAKETKRRALQMEKELKELKEMKEKKERTNNEITKTTIT